MANEITISASLQVSKNGASASATASKSITMSADPFVKLTQALSTSAEALTLTDIAAGAVGYLFLKNLDDTSVISVSVTDPPDANNSFAVLKPGEFCMTPMREEVIYAIADTGTPNLQIVATSL